MDRVAHRGPLARAPGALKGGTSKIVNIFVAVERGLSQNIKKLKGGIFIFGKNLTVPKKKLKQWTFLRWTWKLFSGGVLKLLNSNVLPQSSTTRRFRSKFIWNNKGMHFERNMS